MLKAITSFWRRISRGPRERQAMALLRIVTGLLFLYEGHNRLVNPQLELQLGSQLNLLANQSHIPLFGTLIRQGVLPHLHQLANLVIDGEILVGMSYVTGLFVPLTAWLAILVNLALLLATPAGNPSGLGLNLVLGLVSLVLFWGKAGQQFGLDELLRLSFARSGDCRKTAAGRAPSSRKKSRAKIPVQRSSQSSAKKFKLPDKIKPKAKPNRPVAVPNLRAENVKKFERSPADQERPAKPQSAKVRKLEKVLKREADKQKRQDVSSVEPKSGKLETVKPIPSSEPPKGQVAEEKEMNVVKIFDHRTPDDDE